LGGAFNAFFKSIHIGSVYMKCGCALCVLAYPPVKRKCQRTGPWPSVWFE